LTDLKKEENEPVPAYDKTADLTRVPEELAPAQDSTPSINISEFPFEFGPYKILGEIGRGGMGVVYKGLQTDLDRLVSVKLILSSRLLSRKNVQRFRDEAKTAAKVRHPNIVGIYEASQQLGQHFIAMEYIQGESLAKRQRRAPLPLQEAVQIVAAIARAIAHLHSKEIVHLDLKPSNILIDMEGQPFVTDFGLARGLGARRDERSVDSVSGTPCYMAPEQARGDDWEIGPLSDVYGLGAILYELLTGQPPFKEAHAFETLVEVIEGEPISPRDIAPKIPKTIEKICLKCLEKRPEKRYASAEALADDLDRFLAGDVVETAATGWVDVMKCWFRREPPLASRLIVLALFFAIEMLWFHFFKIRSAAYHYTLLGILGLWGLSALGFQRLLLKPRLAQSVPRAWAVSDVLFLTAALLNSTGIASHLVILYPVLIAASGLWFRIRLVWGVTGVSLASYSLLVVHARLFRPEIHVAFDTHIVFLAALFSLGFLTALLVRRVELLKGYCRSEAATASDPSPIGKKRH